MNYNSLFKRIMLLIVSFVPGGCGKASQLLPEKKDRKDGGPDQNGQTEDYDQIYGITGFHLVLYP